MQDIPPAPLETLYFGNPVWAWIVAVVIALAIPAGVKVAKAIAVSRMKRISDERRVNWLQAVIRVASGLRIWLVLIFSLQVVTHVLVLPRPAARTIEIAAVLALGLQLLIWVPIIVDACITQLMSRTAAEGTPNHDLANSSGVLKFIGVFLMGSLVVLFVLDNMGIQITPLLAGLGVGGIAVALAVQNILGDLFASLSIILDKPFVVGDFVVVGQQMGTVERIGIKTTRVRALSGEQLVFANSDMLSSRIQNFKRMNERRAVFSFGVVYQTPPEALRRVTQITKDAIQRVEKTRFDRCHFKTFGAYSLDFECVYFVLNPDFNLYMDIQQEINLSIFEAFRAEGIEFAFPTAVEIQIDGGRMPGVPPRPDAGRQALVDGASAGRDILR